MQINQFSLLVVAQASSSEGFINSNINNPENKSCKAIELRNIMVPSNPKFSDERKEKSEGEKNIGKEVVIEMKGEKKSEGEKSEQNSEDEVRCNT